MPEITITNPGFLPWLAALSIPLVIHLLTRRAAVRSALPTLAFLRRSLANQSRLFRFRRLLLLALRMLAIGALIAAFLRPTLQAPFSRHSTGRRIVALVLDVSLSMGYTKAGVSSLSRVRSEASALLDDLRPGDLAYVVLSGSAPKPVLPALSGDFGALRQAVKAAEPLPQRGDPAAAVALAVEQLARAGGSGELYLASDFQRTNWTGARLNTLPSGVKLLFLESDSAPRSNAAITGLKLDPPNPGAGEPVQLTVELWNGADPERTIPVSLSVEDPESTADTARITKTSVTVPAFGDATATIPITLPSIGTYRIEARIPADGLKLDTVRYLAVDTRRRMTALIVSDLRADRVGTSAYFLSRALNPVPSRPGGIRVVTKRPSDLTANDLSASDIVLLDGVVDFPPERLALLTRWMTQGGSAIVFLSGPATIPLTEALARSLPRGDALPFRPTTPIDLTGQAKDHVALSEAHYDSPLLRLFKDPAAGSLGAIQFRRYYLTSVADPSAETLLRFEDGAVAAARRTVGAGSLLLCNFAPDMSDNDLARQEVFPPLIHEFVKGMTGTGGGMRDFVPGGSASVPIDPAQAVGDVTAIGPEAEPERVSVDRTTGSVVIDRVGAPGFHTVLANGRPVATVAVNTSPEESDLRALDPRELQEASAGRTAYVVRGERGDMAELDHLRRSTPLWPYCVALALAALLAEEAISGSRLRRSSRPTR